MNDYLQYSPMTYNLMIKLLTVLTFIIFLYSPTLAQIWGKELPLNYVACRTTGNLLIDGRLDEPSWQGAPWTEDFADIEGYHMPAPLYQTHAKILWDDNYLYIGAELEEPHIWATYTENESVIFHENNFEIFIDPDGDTHNYYELEINALGTRWDLMLTKPYRNGGLPISAWDIAGLKTGIHLSGTINNPADTDTLWSVEIAIPWTILKETAPRRSKPEAGDIWRINFSRVQWLRDISGNQYIKRKDPSTGKPLPEHNWIWSPQGLIDMHLPERWGYVQFSGIASGKGIDAFSPDPDEKIKFALREIYHLQKKYFRENGKFASNLNELMPRGPLMNDLNLNPVFEISNSRFLVKTLSTDGMSYWIITDDSRIWKQ
jgi:hypothetical protein